MRLRFGRLIIIGVVVGLGIGDYLHVTDKIRSERDAPVVAQVKNTPAPSATPSASPTDTPLVAGQAAIKISTYRVRLVASDPITDLAYGELQYDGTTEVGFTTEALLAKYPNCKAGSLGYLMRTKARTPSSTRSPMPTPSSNYQAPRTTLYNQRFQKTVGGYTYTYVNPGYNCATDSIGQNLVTQAKAALISDALPTMTEYANQP